MLNARLTQVLAIATVRGYEDRAPTNANPRPAHIPVVLSYDAEGQAVAMVPARPKGEVRHASAYVVERQCKTSRSNDRERVGSELQEG